MAENQTAAPESVVVNITPGDIKFGQKKHVTQHPVAIALAREYGWKSQVGNTWVTIIFAGGCCAPETKWAYELSREAIRFITEFDNGNAVRPQMFSVYKDRQLFS